jgi:hypothetical protein
VSHQIVQAAWTQAASHSPSSTWTYFADLRPPLEAVTQKPIENQNPYLERTVVPLNPDATITVSLRPARGRLKFTAARR